MKLLLQLFYRYYEIEPLPRSMNASVDGSNDYIPLYYYEYCY